MQRMPVGRIAVVALVALSVATGHVEAQIYSWTDAEGVRHFSNVKPDKHPAALEVMTEAPHDAAADERRRIADQAQLERWRESNREDETAASPAAGPETDQPPSMGSAPASRDIEAPARSEVQRDTIYIIERPRRRPVPHGRGTEQQTLLPPSAPPRSRFGHRPSPPPSVVHPPEVRPPEIRPPDIRPPPVLPPPRLNPLWRLQP